MTDNEVLEHAQAIKQYCTDRDRLDDPCENCPFHFYRGIVGICVLNNDLYPNEWYNPEESEEEDGEKS